LADINSCDNETNLDYGVKGDPGTTTINILNENSEHDDVFKSYFSELDSNTFQTKFANVIANRLSKTNFIENLHTCDEKECSENENILVSKIVESINNVDSTITAGPTENLYKNLKNDLNDELKAEYENNIENEIRESIFTIKKNSFLDNLSNKLIKNDKFVGLLQNHSYNGKRPITEKKKKIHYEDNNISNYIECQVNGTSTDCNIKDTVVHSKENSYNVLKPLNVQNNVYKKLDSDNKFSFKTDGNNIKISDNKFVLSSDKFNLNLEKN
jgi:hypothetical protein